jgi:hypothetical protein
MERARSGLGRWLAPGYPRGDAPFFKGAPLAALRIPRQAAVRTSHGSGDAARLTNVLGRPRPGVHPP